MTGEKRYRIPRLAGKKIAENDMEKYDWSKKRFMGATKKWVYYKVPLKETGEYQTVRLFYDPMKDWEFEHEKW
jgi:hypothetical protein